MKQFAIALAVCLCVVPTVRADGGAFSRMTHGGMVAQSGIRPHRVGTHEGVGMSTRSAADAIRNACYWGQRQHVSIQTSYRNGRHYAVVRYR